jgi:hypothetical protein
MTRRFDLMDEQPPIPRTKSFSREFTYLCRRKLGIDLKTSRAVLRLWSKFAKEQLSRGRQIHLDHMGGWKLATYKREGTVYIVPKFKASIQLKAAIQKAKAFGTVNLKPKHKLSYQERTSEI